MVFNITDGVLKNCLGGDKKIVVPDNVKEIKEVAFAGDLTASAIIQIRAEEGKEITPEEWEDFGCWNVEEVFIPKGVENINSCAFSGTCCLKNIVVDKENQFYSSINGCLFNKEGTELLHVPVCKNGFLEIGDNVTKIESGAFYGCMEIRGFDVSKENKFFTSVDGVLYTKDMKTLLLGICFCNRRSKFAVPEGVTEISNFAFESCKSLLGISFSKTVKKIGEYAFFGCDNLKSIIIPDNVSEIERNAFCDCKRLERIKLPKNLEKIEYELLSDCNNLRDVTMPSSVKEIGKSAFSYCQSLDNLIIPDEVSLIGNYAFYESPVTLITSAGSAGEKYAKANGIRCKI